MRAQQTMNSYKKEINLTDLDTIGPQELIRTLLKEGISYLEKVEINS